MKVDKIEKNNNFYYNFTKDLKVLVENKSKETNEQTKTNNYKLVNK